mgnify:CR=1 FL=1
MKLINPRVEQWECGYTLPEIWSHIARCARTCYQSEPRSNGETDEEFVKRVILRNHSFEEIAESRELQLKLHLSVLEHGTVYLAIPISFAHDDLHEVADSPFAKGLRHYVSGHNSFDYITTNMRVIVENGFTDILKFITPPTKYHVLRTTFNIITDIGVARELARHRSHSISEESTRFCNYSKDKFDNELTFIKPEWFNSLYIDKDGHWDNIGYYSHDDRGQIEDFYAGGLLVAERNYLYLLKCGWSPQQARQVLPLSTKVQTIHTAFNDDWEEFIKLRADACSGSVHPNMKMIANTIRSKLYGTNE